MSETFHTYTRKQIASWVQSHTRYKYEDLRNGVFFCKMLTLKFPEDSPVLKYNPTPVSEYDCMSNLNLMKKVLNRRGLQLNLNVQTVLTSKNNFQLARWLRTLFEQPANEQATINNYSNVHPPKDTISTFRDLPYKKSLEQTPNKKQTEEQREEKVKKKMESAEKESKNSLSKIKRLSMAKSQAIFFKDKRSMRTELKIPINRREKKMDESGNQQRLYQTQVMPKQNEVSQNDDMNEVLYQRALEESIASLTKILEKVKKTASNTEGMSFSEYKKSINKAIFTK